MRGKLVLCIGILLILGIAGCTGASEIIGKWVVEGGQNYSRDEFGLDLEFSKDGTGICEGQSVKWRTEKDRLVITFDWGGVAFPYNYKISGSTLILTNDSGISVNYKKE